MLTSPQIRTIQDPMPRKKQIAPPGYLSVEDAADLAGIGRTTAYTYAEPGGLWESEGVRIYRPTSRGKFIRRDDLVKWIERRGGIVTDLSDVDRARIQMAEERAAEEAKQAERDARERAKQEARERGMKQQKPRE